MTSKYHSSKLVLKARAVPLKDRVEFMISQALQPIPEHKFEAIYHYLFNEPMDAKKLLGAYGNITAYVASKPMFTRTLSDDGRAFLQMYVDQSNTLSYRHSSPTWAMTEPSAAEQLSVSLKIYKEKQLLRELDLVGFMAPSEKKFFVTFGKSQGVDFTLSHESISRVHALFQLAKDGALFVFDVSTHGTLLNAKQIPLRKYIELKRGDELRFGHSSRVYVVEMAQSKTKKQRQSEAEEEKERELREMQQRIEQLTKERDSAKRAEERKAKEFLSLREQMNKLKVQATNELEEKKTEEETEEEDTESGRVTKVRGIDFLANIRDLSKLTVAKLKYYTEANHIEIGRVKKAELVKIIRKDLKKHCAV